MALKLDNALLDELGLGGLPDSEKQLLLRQIYEKLEMNVGMRLADQMSNEQLDAFEKFVDANDDKGAFQWLESNFPNYKQVVNEEFEKLKAEIRSVAPQILASAQNDQAQQAATGAPQGLQPQQPYAQPQAPQFPPQGQPQAYAPQPSSVPQYQQPMQPQQPVANPYQQPAQPQPYQPQQYAPDSSAIPQNGHLQPQYGAPQPQQPYAQPQAPQFPPQQPPAGPPAPQFPQR